MQLDPDKVQKQLDKLNHGLKSPAWQTVDDEYYAVTAVRVDTEGKFSFMPAKGLPSKVFINRITGEVRLFHINAFKVDDGE